MVRREALGLLRGIVAALAVVLLATGEGRTATSPDAAATFVGELGNATISVLRSGDATLAQREHDVRQLLRENFALDQIGKFVLGRAWKKATVDQRREYLDLFGEYVLATYAKRLGGYSGESFIIVKAEPIGEQDAVVLTRIDRPSGPPLNAGWRVRSIDGRFLILDVIVEGVSMVAAQRAEFASVVKAQGIEGLLQVLRLQISKFAAQAS